MFVEGAPYFTTHVLIRDYASHIVKLGLLNFPETLSVQEEKFIHSPFVLGTHLTFPVHPDGKDSMGGPIQMDFGNYTIGHIVKGGHSYSNPTEKIKVRGQIYHRIYQLGWNKEEFEEIEERVNNHNGYTNRSQRPKIERYGKKYSWIAYHEIAGYRDDCGLLENDWNEYRSMDVDIDPSFPESVISPKIITDDYLGQRDIPVKEWLKSGDTPNFDKYLELQRVGLFGWLGQSIRSRCRKRFICRHTWFFSKYRRL
jgi:hypothetical protein